MEIKFSTEDKAEFVLKKNGGHLKMRVNDNDLILTNDEVKRLVAALQTIIKT